MSKTNEMIRLAHFKGYRVRDDGVAINSNGKERRSFPRGVGRHKYLAFSIYTPEQSFPIPIHRLQAYQLFGEEALKEGVHTRHLDGNPLNNTPCNIAIGTASDNMMDRPKEDRIAHAQKAGSTNLRTDWGAIEDDYFKEGMGFKKLAAKYGVSLGTLSNHFSQIPGWKPMDLTPEWDEIKDYIRSTGCSYIEASEKFGVSERSFRRKLGLRADFR